MRLPSKKRYLMGTILKVLEIFEVKEVFANNKIENLLAPKFILSKFSLFGRILNLMGI